MKKVSKKRRLFVKIVKLFGIFISISIVILAFLQLIGVTKHADNIFMPELSILMLIQTVDNWGKNKITAYFSLFVAIFIIIVLFIK